MKIKANLILYKEQQSNMNIKVVIDGHFDPTRISASPLRGVSRVRVERVTLVSCTCGSRVRVGRVTLPPCPFLVVEPFK